MKRIIAPFFVCLLGLAITACAGARQPVSHDLDPSYIDEKGNLTDTFDVATHSEEEGPKQAYTKGVVLVKSLEDIDIDSLQLDIKSVEKLFIGSPWQKIILGSTEDTVSAVQY